MSDEISIYPTKWSEFIGQDVAKDQIRTAAQSARKRKAPADHILLATEDPGVGKTALAHLAALAAGTKLFEVQGKVTVGEMRGILFNMRDRDVLLWDEIHGAVDGGKKNIEYMLPLLTGWQLIGAFGVEDVPHIQVIAATTEAHRLPPAIRSRFTQPPMVGYTLDEAARIAVVMSRKVLGTEGLPVLAKRNAVQLAACANLNPRAIGKLLVNLRDLVITGRTTHDGKDYDLTTVFVHAGLTPDGLDFIAQRYLGLLLKSQAEVGERTLRDHLQAPSMTSTERVLYDKGYILKTKTGRTLSSTGLARAMQLAS